MNQSCAENAHCLRSLYVILFIGLITHCLLCCACSKSSSDSVLQTETDVINTDITACESELTDLISTEPNNNTEDSLYRTEYLTLNDTMSVPVPQNEADIGNRLGYIPVLYIQTTNSVDIQSDTKTVSFTMNVEEGMDTIQNNLTGMIKLRGNASLGWEKKSYTITFDEKQDPVGTGRGKNSNWVLISNHCDKSLLRNYIAFWLQDKLDGIAWSPWACMVDLYVNGSYVGNYLLVEKITVGSHRLNIDTVTGGDNADFLIELDNYAYKSGDKGITWFTARGIPYELRGEDVYSQSRCDAVDAYVTTAYDVVCGGNETEIRNILDISSAVDAYIVAELTKNIDCGWSSFFLYSKGGKLYLGPLWDFDLAMGNDYRLDNGSYRRLYAGEDRGFSQGNVWFIELMQQDWFRALVTERWQELYNSGVFHRMLNALSATETVCYSSFKRNFRKWRIFTERINQEPDSLLTSSNASVEAQFDELYKWLSQRITWLNDNGF